MSADSWMPQSTNTRPARNSRLPLLCNEIFVLLGCYAAYIGISHRRFGSTYLSDLEGSSSPRIIPIPKKCRTQHYWLSLKYEPASCFNLGDENNRLSRNAGNQINTNHISCVTFQKSKYPKTGAHFTGLYSFTQNNSLTEFILTLIYYENIILKWEKCACRTKTRTAL
jgi:hypothetical protein